MNMENKLIQKQWYIATTIIGSEESVYDLLIEKIRAYKFEEYVDELKIIKSREITIEIFNDSNNPPPKVMRNTKNIEWRVNAKGEYEKKTTREKNKFPGYIFIKMHMDDDVWYMIRNTAGITGFIGSSGKLAKPIPISEYELEDLFDPSKNQDIITYINGNTTSTVISDDNKDLGSIKFNNNSNNVKNEDFKIDEENLKEVEKEIKEVINQEKEDKNNPISEEILDNLKDFKIGNTVKIIDKAYEGLDGLIKDINYETGMIIIEIDLFGKNLTIELKPNQIKK